VLLKFIRWLSPGDIVDVVVAVKGRHANANWPGKGYNKLEEVNVELSKRWPQIVDMSRRTFEKLEWEDEDWFKRADAEDNDQLTKLVEEAERIYKEALLSFGATGKPLEDMPDSLMEAGKEFGLAMKNAAEGERTLSRIALYRHAKITVETKLSNFNELRAVFTQLMRKDPRTAHFEGKSHYSVKISSKFVRWLSPGDIVDAAVAVKGRHADPNWPGKDYHKLEEVNVELRNRWPQIQALKSGPKRFDGLEEPEEEQEREEQPKKKAKGKRERVSGETSGYETNSGDFSRFGVAYLDEAVLRLGKRFSERKNTLI
jgi:hypothetical protein